MITAVPAPKPDDPRANDKVNYILAGLLAIPIMAFALGAIVIPPAVMITLIAKGRSQGNTGYLVAGSVLGALWLLMLYGFTKSLFGKRAAKYGSIRPGESEADDD